MRHLFALALVILALAPVARAQGLRAEALTPDERQSVIITLRLTGEEIDTLDELNAAATAERAEIVRELTEFISSYWEEQQDAMRDGADPDMALIMQRMGEAREELDGVQSRMLDDLALLLPDDRKERVQRCRLRLYRMGVLYEMGESLSGFAADPVIVAHDIGVPARLDDASAERFDRAMLSYDRAIAKSFKEFEELQERSVELTSRTGMDPSNPEAVAFLDTVLAYLRELQDTHRTRARAVANTLPPELRAEWHDAWQRRAYPEVFAPHYIEIATRRLIASRVLTDDERESVRVYADTATTSLARARRALCDAIDEAESGVTVEQATRDQGITSDEVREKRAELDALASAARDRLLALIDPTRHDQIPPLEPELPTPGRIDPARR
ncbi:MAG: hypothetical protein AAGH64_02335 [Planctomycetota bacterium]